MYMAAYNYILNDSINNNRLIVVADSIVDLDRYWVTGLEQFPEEYKKLARYIEKQMKRMFATSSSYSPLLASLFHDQDVKLSNAILFFSRIIDLMLRADINILSKNIWENMRSSTMKHIYGGFLINICLFSKKIVL